MKKIFSICLISLLTFSLGRSQKMEIFEMTLTADVIARGMITKIGPLSVTVEVTHTYGGECAKDIEVTKFINVKNDRRWGKYTKGEELLLFLEGSGGNYKIMGSAGEGEKLFADGSLFLDYRGGGVFNQYNYHDLSTGVRIYGEKISHEPFLEVIQTLRQFYSLTITNEIDPQTGLQRRIIHTKLLKPESELDAVRLKSETHDKLVEDAYKHLAEEK